MKCKKCGEVYCVCPIGRANILDTARDITCRGREEQHGAPENNFATIAAFWRTYLKRRNPNREEPIFIDAVDVGLMMALLKISRAANGDFNIDDYIDGAGYFACAGELAGGDRA